jgi:DNA-directed RNA polymerase specialized sigma24 family protein
MTSDELLAEGSKDLENIGPDLLNKHVVAMIFLPWLSRYTGRLIRAAKQEEREQILQALPSLPEDMRQIIVARGEPGYVQP